MNWLLWKEFRQNLPVVIAGVIFLLTPHLLALYAACWDLYHGYFLWERCCRYVLVSSFYSIVLSQLVVAAIGGNAFAGERIDRSAEFLASLPISRRRILATKLLFAFIVVGTIWLSNGMVLMSLSHPGMWISPDQQDIPRILAEAALVGSVFFSVAWMFSSFLNSPTYAALAGILTPAIYWTGILFCAFMFQLNYLHLHGLDIIRWLCLATAPISFVLGVCFYLRRVEP